ncbi:hypothetical protein GCM10009830_29840 [Glycomyces endophyticus]|uniref:DUF2975 domain-containing protein n=1 Tax=Glycomyces endophyticus TaxID=480996 RepID=A0ABP4T1K9_9ACTN
MSQDPPPAPHAPAPFPPVAERPPGVVTAAVVLLWVLLAVGACGSAFLPVSAYLTEAWADDGLERGLGAVVAASSAVLVALTVARGLLAVRVKRRGGRARVAAIAVEGASLTLSVASWIVVGALAPVTSTSTVDGALETTTSYGPNVVAVSATCPGMLMSVLVIVFLSLADAKRWCDR